MNLEVLLTWMRNKCSQTSVLLALGKLDCVGESIDVGERYRTRQMEKLLITMSVLIILWADETQIFESRNIKEETRLDASVKTFPCNRPLHGRLSQLRSS